MSSWWWELEPAHRTPSSPPPRHSVRRSSPTRCQGAAGVIPQSSRPVTRSSEAMPPRAALRPDVVLRIGSAHASRVLATRLHDWALAGTEQVLLDDRWRFQDPDRDAGTVLDADVTSWCRSVGAHLAATSKKSATGAPWRRNWTIAESAAQEVITRWCAEHPEATEPGVARAVVGALRGGALLVVASSMPVRDLEWFGGALDDPPRVLANRGANGIDGVVSTAMGAAAAGGGPVVALVGDLAFLHDLTALVGVQGEAPAITIVVVDNGGGGIFSFLPQRAGVEPATFDELFGTPPSTGVSAAARGLGVAVEEVSTIAGLEEALLTSVGAQHTTVVRVGVPTRDENVQLHDEINSEVAKRVSDLLADAG